MNIIRCSRWSKFITVLAIIFSITFSHLTIINAAEQIETRTGTNSVIYPSTEAAQDTKQETQSTEQKKDSDENNILKYILVVEILQLGSFVGYVAIDRLR